ncbi:uncharacterized protein LOC123922866 [Trifolium pratense]|uniref:uncharacterized protein LOC123922866 n=1 Tax=Trifolium pratense TaxID=57577 RepID=UPI001E691A56|nr:uncharacterized protein LOC123922866 [Trifolium pratense]
MVFHPRICPLFNPSWQSYNISGKKTFVLKEKFKLLRESLKNWNKEVFGFLDLNIEKTITNINEFEDLLANSDGDLDDLKLEGLNKEFWKQLHFKESLLKQKSRTTWIREGDSNSKYFHQSIKSRRRRNQLVALKDGNHWVQGVDDVKSFVKNFFEKNFTEEWSNRPLLDGVSFNSLSETDNYTLLAPFSVEEVRDILSSCDRNKCPGPDGFNFNFLKTCWDVLQADVMEFLIEFHSNAILPKAITASFLALIPKKDHPQVLAARLKKVMGKLISECQTAFPPNRQILDGVLVVNERIDLAKRRKDKCLLLKLNVRARLLVNGSPTEDFLVGKGLRQGDPLSPFLFLIAAEGLTRLMQKAVDNSSFHGFKVRDDLHFHTLQFADDTVLIGEGNWDNLWSIKTVPRSFKLVSGLKVNFFKSILVGANPRRKITWNPIVVAMKKRLNAWNGRHLSIGGRVTLINSHRYGNMVDNFMSQSTNDVKGHSLWWRDIMKIGGVVNGDWFKKNVSNVLGDGISLRFWHDVWLGPVCFKRLFPLLFNKALYPNIVVGASGMWQDHTWVWKMEWSLVLSAAEQELAQELYTLLTGFFPYPNDKDSVRWNIHQTGQFSVHSTYVFLLSRVVTLAIEENVVEALNQLWTNDLPSKVSIFGWRLLLSRLPTRMALAKKGVIVNPRFKVVESEMEDIDLDLGV